MEETDRRPIAGTDRVHDAWERHHAPLWRAVFAWSGDRDVASDAVAEAFAQCLRRGDAVDDVGKWVWRAAFRIAGGLLQDRRRTDGGGRAVPERPTPAADTLYPLLDALARLRPTDRELVVLALVGGWSPTEIAALTGTAAGTVRVRLHRARGRLRDLMEET